MHCTNGLVREGQISSGRDIDTLALWKGIQPGFQVNQGLMTGAGKEKR